MTLPTAGAEQPTDVSVLMSSGILYSRPLSPSAARHSLSRPAQRMITAPASPGGSPTGAKTMNARTFFRREQAPPMLPAKAILREEVEVRGFAWDSKSPSPSHGAAVTEDTKSTCSPVDSLATDAGLALKEVAEQLLPFGSSLSTREPSLDGSWPAVAAAGIAAEKPIDKRLTCGAYSLAGLKSMNPHWTNQDVHFAVELGPMRVVVGVFDGHGQHGHIVANYFRQKADVEIRNLFPVAPAAISDENIQKAFKSLFASLHSDVASLHILGRPLAEFSGSTGTLVYIDSDAGRMAVAHVGDSATIIVKEGRCLRRSQDHVVDEAAEIRVRARGGEVRHMTYSGISAQRVFLPGLEYPGLAMARALGDLVANSLGVEAEPEVHTNIPITPGTTVVVASDGVWEKVDAAEASAIIGVMQDPQRAARDLVDYSRQKWSSCPDIDDITVVVVQWQAASGTDMMFTG